MNAGSKVPLDLNLTLVHHGSPGDHPSCHGHYGSISSDDEDHKEHLDDPAHYYNSAYYDDPSASSSRVGADSVSPDLC